MRVTEQNGYLSIPQFLKLYKTPDTIKSTIRQYLTIIYPEHQDEIKRNDNIDALDELGEQYINECKAGRNWGLDLLSYKNSPIIGKGGSVNAKISRVRVWLDWNDLPLSPRLSKTLYDPSTSRITSNYGPTRDEIKRACDHLDLPYKTLTLMLLSSGARCGSETMMWKISDIDWNHDPVRIFQVPSRPPKNRAPFIFISDEARDHLERWLKIRSDWIERVYTHHPDKLARLRHDDQIFPFTHSNYRKIFQDALKRAGLNQRDPRNHSYFKIRVHGLRKSFRNAFIGAKDIAQLLMGQTSGVDSRYFTALTNEGSPEYQEIVNIYKEKMVNLTISEEYWKTGELEAQNKELVSNNKEVKSKLDQTEFELRTTIMTQNMKIAELSKTVEDLILNMGQYFKQMNLDPHEYDSPTLAPDFDPLKHYGFTVVRVNDKQKM